MTQGKEEKLLVNSQTGEIVLVELTLKKAPKKALSFWSHTGNYDKVKMEFPEATFLSSRFKHGLPLVHLWTLQVEEENYDFFLTRVLPYRYDFGAEEDSEVILLVREIAGELLEILDARLGQYSALQYGKREFQKVYEKLSALSNHK